MSFERNISMFSNTKRIAREKVAVVFITSDIRESESVPQILTIRDIETPAEIKCHRIEDELILTMFEAAIQFVAHMWH